jgi:hypothetical protein
MFANDQKYLAKGKLFKKRHLITEGGRARLIQEGEGGRNTTQVEDAPDETYRPNYVLRGR